MFLSLFDAGRISLGATQSTPPAATKSLGSPLILFTVLLAAAILLIAVLALLRMLRESVQRDVALETPPRHKPIAPSAWEVAGKRAKPIDSGYEPDAADRQKKSAPRPQEGA